MQLPHKHTRKNTQIHTHTHANTYAHTNTHTYKNTHTRTHTHILANKYTNLFQKFVKDINFETL